MYLFLLGNGFDLHYNLPTSYPAFLKTVTYLLRLNASGEKVTSVAQIFGANELQAADAQIKACMERYGKDYDAVIGEEVYRIIDLARSNFWFSYFNNATIFYNNWVDFEAEVARVIHTLERNKENIKKNQHGIPSRMCCYILPKNDGDAFTLSNLDIFEKSDPQGNGTRYFYFSQQYNSVDPPGSQNYIVNWSKISEHLSASLKDLAEMLALYLRIFIEAPLTKLIEKNAIHKELLLNSVLGGVQDKNGNIYRVLEKSAFVVTFNYTRTCEFLYPNTHFSSWPTHIHGSLQSSDVILGINSDKTDEIAPVDTTFLPFKKYFQRILHGTSRPFFSLCERNERGPLYVIGHSLDETDQEIFMELFRIATKITIFCHKPEAKAEYLHKLARVYTKAGLESLYKDKRLNFVDVTMLDDVNYVVGEGLANKEDISAIRRNSIECGDGFLS